MNSAADCQEPVKLGDLWRDVVNSIGANPTPGAYLPLLDHVAPRWADWTYFLGRMAEVLRRDRTRAEIEGEVTWALMGYRIWMEQRVALARWAAKGQDGPMTDEQVADWWLGGQGGIRTLHELKRLPQFLKAMRFDEREQQLIDAMVANQGPGILIYRMREHLVWVPTLEKLREVATKTWPANPRDRIGWTEDDLTFVNEYYQEQAPGLTGEQRNGIYDPFELESSSMEGSLGMGGSVALNYCMYVLLRAAVIDFADELLDAARYPNARGSLRCVECGHFVGRRALGYGQTYCGETCKKRVAKRRYRARVKARLAGKPMLEVVR